MLIGISMLILQGLILYFAFIGLRYTLSKQQNSQGTIFIRDILKYAALILAVFITCIGLAGILGKVLESGSGTYSSRIDLARWMSFSVIGIPVIAIIARWVKRDFAQHPEAKLRPAWQIYLFAGSTSSLLLWFIPLQSYLKIFAGAEYRPRALSQAIIAFLVWLIHMVIIRGINSLPVNAHRFIGWFSGATSIVVGAVTLLDHGIKTVVDFDREAYQIAEGSISLAVGAIAFAIYWGLFNCHTQRQENRIYRTFGGIAIPSLFLSIAAIFVVNSFLTWNFGRTPLQRNEYFREVPQQVSVVLVLSLVVIYFRITTRGFYRDEIARLYHYLIGGIALTAASVGIANIVIGALAWFDRANTIIFGGSLALITLPQWLYLWRQSQRALTIDFASESGSPIRRTYLYIFVGVPALVAMVSTVWLTFNLFKAILVGNQELWQSRVPIGALGVALLLAGYHSIVLRRERS